MGELKEGRPPEWGVVLLYGRIYFPNPTGNRVRFFPSHQNRPVSVLKLVINDQTVGILTK
jgi:hypothetical protein